MAQDAKKVTVKRVFGSFVNNATAIDGAKFSPWWVGLIMFILGLLLPVLPLFVSAAKTEGTTFMSSYEYGLGLDKTFGEAINSLSGTLTFNNQEKTISYESTTPYYEGDSSLIGGYIATSGQTSGQYDLRIFYLNSTDENEMSTFIAAKNAVAYTKGTTNPTLSGDNTYIPSSIYFFKNTFLMDIYASNSNTRQTVMSSFADLNCLDYDGGDLKAYFVGTSFNKDIRENRINAVNNLKEFLNTTYETTRTKQMWIGSLIYLGIYTAIQFFMVLMIFLMSRGKNNPNNYLTFWHCIKIDWWESLCPGLLGMIFGFIFSGSATTIYIMLITMRTMWLTMKELRPQM